jgi:hypothetical protein
MDRLRRRVVMEEGPPRGHDEGEGEADSVEDLRSEAEENEAGGWAGSPYKGKRAELAPLKIPEREPLAGRAVGNDPLAGVEGEEGRQGVVWVCSLSKSAEWRVFKKYDFF